MKKPETIHTQEQLGAILYQKSLLYDIHLIEFTDNTNTQWIGWTENKYTLENIQQPQDTLTLTYFPLHTENHKTIQYPCQLNDTPPYKETPISERFRAKLSNESKQLGFVLPPNGKIYYKGEPITLNTKPRPTITRNNHTLIITQSTNRLEIALGDFPTTYIDNTTIPHLLAYIQTLQVSSQS